MFAVIKTGGKQYKVAEGDTLTIEKIKHENDEVSFDQVFLISGDDLKIGRPLINGAVVEAKVIKEGKGVKKMVVRYKSKTRQRKTKGHRQPYTKVKITKIST